MFRRALATAAAITVTLAVWSPVTFAADSHGHSGDAGSVSAPGKSDEGDKGKSGEAGQNKPAQAENGKSAESNGASGSPAACVTTTGTTGTTAGSTSTTTGTTGTTTSGSTTTTDSGTTSTTTSGSSGTTDSGSTGTTTSGSTEDQTNCRGQDNHLEAVQKVMDKLQAKIANMNPTAAANVSDVISRLEDELKASGAATDEKGADEQLDSALSAKATSGTSSKSDLDVLAEVQSKLGKDYAARSTREQRIMKDPADKDGYVALAQTLSKNGAPSEITTFVEGKKVAFDVKPVIREGHTLVPVRAIVEALGAKVQWDPATSTVTITKDTTVVQLVIGSNTATINGNSVTLEVPAGLEGSRTVIPARFVAEMLGMKVDWLPDGKVIVVTSGGISSGGTSAGTTTDTTGSSTGTTTDTTGTTTDTNGTGGH